MNKPLIAVSASHAYPEGKPAQGILSLAYVNAVEENGGLPALVTALPETAAQLAERFDGLLLSGGCDVDPARFGQENRGTGTVDARRDDFELAICKEMLRLGKPVLGICRGIQVLNVAMGGTLVQDIPSWLGIDHPNGTGLRHEITVKEGAFLEPEITGTWRVNSTHHQSVDKLGEGLEAVAWSENGRVIEAVQAADGRPIFGVQWHPERLRAEDAIMDSIFKKFIEACK